MLQFIRDRAQGWIAWVIVILIIIPFALWGINQYFGGGKDQPAAVVEGVDISPQQVQQAYYQQRQRIQQMLGSAFRPEMFPEERMRQQVLQQLIQQELLVQAAGRAGMRVGDEQLAETIRGIEAFQQDGRFSNALYEQVLMRQGMQPGHFEFRLRRDLVAEQFSSGVEQTAFATPDEQSRYLRLSRQSRDVGWLTFQAEHYLDRVQVSDEAMQAYYDEHAQQFVEPEKVRIAYLELDAAAIARGIAVGEEELQRRYEAQKLNYRVPEERRARHLLIEVSADADAEAEAAAEAEAQALLAQVREGAEFAELAKEHSQDPGSAEQGGDLGYFGRGMMDPAFEEATFGLEQGGVAGPVRSAFGYHLIKLEDVRGGEVKSFDAVRDQIAAEVRKEEAEQRFYEMAEQLANLTYEHPDSLQPAAEQLGIDVQESGWMPRSGGEAEVTREQKVIAAAFNEELRQSGYNSEVIELSPTHLVVLRPRDHREASQQPLAEVRDRVEAAVRRELARDQAREAAEAAVARLREGAVAKELAEPEGGQWTRNESLERDAGGVAAAIVEAAFAMPRPGDERSLERVTLRNGDQAVLVLYGVEDGDAEAVAPADREQAGQRLARAYGEAAFNGVLGAVRARSDVAVPR